MYSNADKIMKQGFRRFVCLGIASIVLFLLPGCSKKTDISLNPDLLAWSQEIIEIPVYLPTKWSPMKAEDDSNHFYFEAEKEKESYSLAVYQTSVAIKFNDEDDLLEKNGPISESSYLGSISGGTTAILDEADFTIPEDTQEYDLTDSIKAYKSSDDTSVWWNNGGWEFAYVGSSGNEAMLEKLATEWEKSEISIAKEGKIEIIGGNKITLRAQWSIAGMVYSFETADSDPASFIEILNSFEQITK